MIYILHGQDAVKSRILLLNQQKKLGIEARVEMEINDITPLDLYEKISQRDIFGEKHLIVLNITLASSGTDQFINVIKKTPEETVLVLYAEKPLGKTNAFIKHTEELSAKVIENEQKPQSNIFKFTDNVFYKNRQQAYKELEKLLNEGEDEFRIFGNLLYSLRNITYCVYECSAFYHLKPFQKNSVQKQASLQSRESIKKLYQNLYEIEKMVKTGKITPEIMLTCAIEKIMNS